MATKGVLGNDPFQRGAAQRSTEAVPSPKKAKAPGGKAAKKAAKPASKGRKQSPASAPSEEIPLRLREPSAPAEPPRRRSPARRPSAPGKLGEQPPSQPAEKQEAEQELSAAAAMEASEAAAKAATEVAVEAILALQAHQSGAAAAPPGSLEEAWNRELATAVVTEATEAAAEAALGAARSAGRAGYSDRMAMAQALEELVDSEEEDDSSSFSAEVTVIDRAYTEAAPEGFDAEAAAAEPEQELPDSARDEYVSDRETPLSLVPPPLTAEPAREPFFTDQAAREPEPSTVPRSVGMFSLAKEMALQALSSASMGKALGAAHGLLHALRAGLGTSGSTSLDEYGRDSELVSGLQPLLDFLYERYWRVSVQGIDQVPSGGAILVANHSGALPYDGLVASLALLRERPELREPRWLVEDQIFHAPMLGTLFNRLGAVRACPENAMRLLDEQRPVLVFPEGYQGLSKPFAQRYQLKRFGRGGFVKLALRTGAPIIPVSIVGSEETSPLLGRIPASFLGVPYVPLTSPVPLPARWTLRFGEPISMEGLDPDAADDLAEVQRLAERTRESIQGMLQALLRERRSVFAG
jgi:1-acyl-sn-glycerol-3-phosphate acyltransferase